MNDLELMNVTTTVDDILLPEAVSLLSNSNQQQKLRARIDENHELERVGRIKSGWYKGGVG